MSLSPTAPQPGETLTIAGYGSGNFRAATARCTQYVTPGRSLPFEMVEVGTEARQGDSGGPILNERGEIAGVLFGAGGGTTSGSYVGRVRTFLATVSPRDILPPSNVPSANPGARRRHESVRERSRRARIWCMKPTPAWRVCCRKSAWRNRPRCYLWKHRHRRLPVSTDTGITPLADADEMVAIPSTAAAASSSHLVTFGALPTRLRRALHRRRLLTPTRRAPQKSGMLPVWSRPLPNQRPSVSSATNENWGASPPAEAGEPRRGAPTDLAALCLLARSHAGGASQGDSGDRGVERWCCGSAAVPNRRRSDCAAFMDRTAAKSLRSRAMGSFQLLWFAATYVSAAIYVFA